MRVLIDCGAHTGDSLPDLHRLFGPFDKVYAFEPNPECTQRFDPGSAVPTELIPAAVWTREGEIRFYLGEHPSECSLLLEKTTGRLTAENWLQVPCVDFSRWLEGAVKGEDYVVLKLDIEGAEFAVLEKMLLRRTAALVDLLLPEWHADRLPMPRMRCWRRRWIEVRLRMAGVKTLRWSKKYLRKKGYSI